MRATLPFIAAVLATACASRTPESTTPARTELVVDEALVVEAAPTRDAHGLPPLPQRLSSSSEVFQRGHAEAIALLEEPGPPPLSGTDAAAYEAWTRGPFTEWMQARSTQTEAAVKHLGAVQSGPPSEHVVAAALVGMVYARLIDQLVAIPPPTHLASDPLLAKHYRKGLDDAAKEWRDGAQGAFFHCAKHAAEQTDAAFGPWLELCHEQLAALDAQRKQAEQRAQTLQVEAEAARLQAAGPPPEGPEICWKPHAAGPASDVAGVATGDGAPAEPRTRVQTGTTQAEPAQTLAQAKPAAAVRCALSPDDTVARDPIEPRSARDSVYGVRDEATGVRVSVATEPLPSMDLHPLAAAAPHAALAACFAKHVDADKPITVAVHASFDVDARGRVKATSIAPEPSDLAKPPSAALRQCIQRTLKAVRFGCSPSGRPTQGKTLVCMRRD